MHVAFKIHVDQIASSNDDDARRRIMHYAFTFLDNMQFECAIYDRTLHVYAFDDCDAKSTIDELRDVVATFTPDDDQQRIAHECIQGLMTIIR